MNKNIAIVLHKVMYGGNLGLIAMVMKNFGFYDLRITGDLRPDEEAKKRAMHAQDILEDIRYYPGFDEVRDDFDLLVGTSGDRTWKDNNFLRRCVSVDKLAKKLGRGKIGIVFGPEDNGLTNQELRKCDLVVSIPTQEMSPSLNISHAVAIVLYEISDIELPKRRIPTKVEMERLKDEISGLIDGMDLRSPDTVKLMLDRIIGRSELTGREIHTLIGLIKKIKR
jgi:TrmH family RNA methyltransferase